MTSVVNATEYTSAQDLLDDTVGDTYSFGDAVGPEGRQSLYDVVYTGSREGALGTETGKYTHDSIDKKYYFRHYQTQTPGPATLYTGTHTTRTHRYRHITANKHSFIHTRTVHINADHAAAGEANRYREIDDEVFTDQVGAPLSPQTVELQWSGTNWVLPSDFTNNDAQTKYFVIAQVDGVDDIYKPVNTVTNKPSSFPDSDAIPNGITSVGGLDSAHPDFPDGIAPSLDDEHHESNPDNVTSTTIPAFISEIKSSSP